MAAFNFSVAASFFALDTGEAGGLVCRGDDGCTTPLLLGLDGCAEIGPRGGGPVVWLVSDGGGGGEAAVLRLVLVVAVREELLDLPVLTE